MKCFMVLYMVLYKWRVTSRYVLYYPIMLISFLTLPRLLSPTPFYPYHTHHTLPTDVVTRSFRGQTKKISQVIFPSERIV